MGKNNYFETIDELLKNGQIDYGQKVTPAKPVENFKFDPGASIENALVNILPETPYVYESGPYNAAADFASRSGIGKPSIKMDSSPAPSPVIEPILASKPKEDAASSGPMPVRKPAAPALPIESKEMQSPAQMNQQVKDYLMKKFDLGAYSDENRKKIIEENSAYNLGDRTQAALAALGAGFMGKDANAAGNAVLDRQKAERLQRLSDFDKGRANKIQEWNLDRDVTKAEREDKQYGLDQERLMREMDPSSNESKLAQELARKMGYQGNTTNLTAEQFKAYSPVLSKMYEIEQKKLDRAEAREARDFERRNKRFDEELTLEVPGFTRSSKVKPTKKEAEEARKALGSFKTLNQSLDRMDELVKKNGSFEYGGKSGAEMETLATTIKMSLKELYDLGAITGPDMSILQSQVSDPTALSSLFTKDKTARGGISSTKEQLEQKFMNGMSAKGYMPENVRDKSAAKKEGPYGPTVKQDGILYTWNPEKGEYE